jgi:hypothetical protein
MKKSFVLCTVFAMFILAIAISTPVLASDGEISPEKLEKKFSLEGTLKFDFYVPKGKRAFVEPGLFIYAHYNINDWGLGAGVDQWGGFDKVLSNHYTVRPFATVNWRQFYAIAGYSTDTCRTGDDHVFFGMWYIDKIGKFDLFLDTRHFQSVNSRISSYIDIYGEVKYALDDLYKVGVVGEYIGWFGKERSHNWSFAGIEGERKFKYFSVGLRPGVAWDMTSKCGTVPTFWLRTYITF